MLKDRKPSNLIKLSGKLGKPAVKTRLNQIASVCLKPRPLSYFLMKYFALICLYVRLLGRWISQSSTLSSQQFIQKIRPYSAMLTRLKCSLSII